MRDKPISDLRRRMIADVTVRSFSDKTQHDYIRHIETFAGFLGRLPRYPGGTENASILATVRGSIPKRRAASRWLTPSI
jgi:hypothetical protein